MSQKQEQYTKIITDEDNKKWFASLTEQEQTDLKLNTYRSFRNQKLQKTDEIRQKFLSQTMKYEKNPTKFFKDEIENFQYIANKMLKKISKLYNR